MVNARHNPEPEVIADRTAFTLSPEQWEAFAEALARPPMLYPKPRLMRLFSKISVAESR